MEKLLELVYRWSGKSLEEQARESLNCDKWNSTGVCGDSLEDQNAARNVDSEHYAPKDSD
jgi:hypothetical protein